MSGIPLPEKNPAHSSRFTDGFELVLVSLIILFLELACIRWFPAHVLYLTFFTNVVLLASFLGMSVGCLAAGRARNYLIWTPVLLVISLAAAQAIEMSSNSFMSELKERLRFTAPRLTSRSRMRLAGYGS